MKAWDFCSLWFNADSEDQQERGYKAKCVALLSKALKVRENTIQRWGSKFENMPDQHEATLSYLAIIHNIVQVANSHHGEVLYDLVKRIVD